MVQSEVGDLSSAGGIVFRLLSGVSPEEAKDLLGHARVIFISGYAERDIAKQLDDDRAVSFLPKPFTVRQLAERVKQELGSPKKEAA